MENIELGGVKGMERSDHVIRNKTGSVRTYVQCNTVARSCNPFNHGNATVRSALLNYECRGVY